MGEPVIHPTAVLGSRVVVGMDAAIGPNCYIDGDTTIGARTRLVGGITIVGNASIGEDCLIETGVSMTLAVAELSAPLEIGAGVHVGARSVLTAGTKIGANARIEVGTIVSRNVPAHAIVKGNPGSVVEYKMPSASVDAMTRLRGIGDPSQLRFTKCSVPGVKLYKLPRFQDMRGDLSVGEFKTGFPFDPKRYFLIYGVPDNETRGEHAHKTCEQLLVCVHGSISVVVDDGTTREEFRLSAPDVGLYIPPRVWACQHSYSPGGVLLVLASQHYDREDYIESYEDFLAGQRPAA